MLQTGKIYLTEDKSVAHLHSFVDGEFHGAIADNGLCAWTMEGICRTGYHGWDIPKDATPQEYTTPNILARRAGMLKAPAMGVYPGGVADAQLSPAMWWDRQGYTGPITLVLHATAGGGSALNVFRYFLDATVLKCSHFIVGTNGEIYQCGDIHWAAAANGSCTSTSGYWNTSINGNFFTVSIEIFKPDTANTSWPTAAQYGALIPLVKWICESLKIPKREINSAAGGITSHSFFDPVHRPGNYDPGNMDWIKFYAGILGDDNMGITINTPGVSAHFSEVSVSGDRRWVSKANGFYIRGGLLADYQNFPVLPGYAELGALSLWGIPTGNEKPHPTLKGVAIQPYERAVRQFDMSRLADNPPGVTTQAYSAHIPSGTVEVVPQVYIDAIANVRNAVKLVP